MGYNCTCINYQGEHEDECQSLFELKDKIQMKKDEMSQNEQVIWVCDSCKFVAYAKHEFPETETCALCFNSLVTYIPHSKYLALQSSNTKLREALTSLVGHTEATLQFPHKDKIDLVMSLDRAKEALEKDGA